MKPPPLLFFGKTMVMAPIPTPEICCCDLKPVIIENSYFPASSVLAEMVCIDLSSDYCFSFSRCFAHPVSS